MHLRLDPNGPWGGAKQQLDSLQQAKQGGGAAGLIGRNPSVGTVRASCFQSDTGFLAPELDVSMQVYGLCGRLWGSRVGS